VKKLLLAVLSLSVLTACGGGGGGSASVSGGSERVGAIQERIEIVPQAAANSN
jgi:hypothetical protein